MNFTLLFFVVFCTCVEICLAAQKFNEYKHHTNYLEEIPKRFEIKDANARAEFTKYVNAINELAKKANVTVKYKVKVEVSKPEKRHSFKDKKMNKGKSKKYNVPLKKKSMKLSNFEMIMRKHVEAMAKTMAEEDQNPVTTEKQLQIPITRWGLIEDFDFNSEFGFFPQTPKISFFKPFTVCSNNFEDHFMTAITDAVVMVDYWTNII